jgi:hypothetical protein
MSATSGPSPGRLRRLAEELGEIGEIGLPLDDDAVTELLLTELDHALRPAIHERRVASSGVILDPSSDPSTWEGGTGLTIVRAPVPPSPDAHRLFADGLSSWLLRRPGSDDEWLMFDRPAGSERDLVVLGNVMASTIVQRHPSGTVRIVGDFGVVRWDGLAWHHERPVSSWIDTMGACGLAGEPSVLGAMLEFAVHDLGALGVGAILIYRSEGRPGPAVEERFPIPPPLEIRAAFHLAPLRHALAQLDGAAVFDHDGVLRRLGVRVIPSPSAEEMVEPLGGTRHTSARRYSYDDPTATVIVVSEDGPVTVLRDGKILGRSARQPPTDDG